MRRASETECPLIGPTVAEALAADYRILARVGSGELGTVFLAEQIRVGHRPVALKVLHRQFSADPFVTRFLNAAASTGRITHPNVITIYEAKQAADGTPYIATEFVEGESLTQHLHRRGRLPFPEVVDIFSQCCKALEAAHRGGVLHGGLTPDRIMLTRGAEGGLLVKVLNFGMATLADPGGDPGTVRVLGSLEYLAYEQASELPIEQWDRRADIYSLGLVTYAMLVGHPPFRAGTAIGCVAKHLFEAPPPLETERADLTPAEAAAVMKALEKDRARRYQTAAEFAAALGEAATGSPPVPESAAEAEVTPRSTPPWRARHPAPERAGTVSLGGLSGPVPALAEAPGAIPRYAPPWRRRTSGGVPHDR